MIYSLLNQLIRGGFLQSSETVNNYYGRAGLGVFFACILGTLHVAFLLRLIRYLDINIRLSICDFEKSDYGQ
jgi:hypothetical protein